MSPGFQCVHDPVLLCRIYPREDIYAIDQHGQGVVVHLFEFTATHDIHGFDSDGAGNASDGVIVSSTTAVLVNLKAQLLAYLAGNNLIIAGQYLEPHAGLSQQLQRFAGGLLKRVDKSDKPQKDHVLLIGHGIGRFAFTYFKIGHSEDPVSMGA